MKLKSPDMKYHTLHSAVFSCHYHVAWCTKYRRQVLSVDMQTRLKDLLLEKPCEYVYEVQGCEVLSDHVHLLLSITPSKGVSSVVGRLKGYTAHILRSELDLTRFGGYLISNQKGAPLCHQHVPLIQPS